MIRCSEAVQRLWDYLENDVSPTDRDAIEAHLAFCRRCCGEVEFAEELRRLLATAAEVDLSPAVERHLTRALDQLDDGDQRDHPVTRSHAGDHTATHDTQGGIR